MDIVKFIQTEAILLGWKFSYGNEANNNLIESTKEIDTIYLMLDPVITDEPDTSEFGGDGDISHTIRFMLLVQSDLDNVYFEQKEGEEDKGKYIKNILPLKTELKFFKDVIDCSRFERTGWRILEVIDVKGANFDGLILTTVLKENTI